MVESNNPEIDVEWLMDNIREEVRRKKASSQSYGLNRPSLNSSRIDALISAIETSSRPRTHFPNVLQRFPFTWSQWLQKFVLKAYELISRDQRMINMSLASVLREMKNYNTRLAEHLMQQQDRMAHTLEKLSEEQRNINAVLSKLAGKNPIAD